jgi:hypothetical protein
MSVLFIDKPGGSGPTNLLEIGRNKTARRGIVTRMRHKRKNNAAGDLGEHDKENARPGKRANSGGEIRGKYRINILFLKGFE